MSNIKVSLPDGSVKEFEAGSSLLSIAKSLNQKLGKTALLAKVDGENKDLSDVLDHDAKVEFVTPEAMGRCWSAGVVTAILLRQELLKSALRRMNATASAAPGAKASSRWAVLRSKPSFFTISAASHAPSSAPDRQ